MTSDKSIREFFTERLGRSYDPRFAGLSGTLRVSIGASGTWRLSIDNGNLELIESADSADCIIEVEEADLLETINGRRNLFTAFLQGRVRVQGDRALAAGVQHFFKPETKIGDEKVA